ncbi:MAG TPA: hypothetical protein V6D25_23635 [Leptolyngbyaceae cyanobacterium]
MNTQIISGLLVLLGVITGNIITYLSNKNLKLAEWRLSIKKDEIVSRKKLYADFLGEVNRIILFSIEKKFNSTKDFERVGQHFCQIELTASEDVIEKAKLITDAIFVLNTQSSNQQNSDIYNLKKSLIESIKTEISNLEKDINT